MTYQVKRTTITTFVHLTLPLIYCIGMSMVEPQIYTVSVNLKPNFDKGDQKPAHVYCTAAKHTNY